MATSQVTIFSFTCFIVHHTPITHDPRRRHPYSTSNMVVFHSLLLLKISVNKKKMVTKQKLKSENYDITKFLLPLETHSKYITAKENIEAFSGELRVHLVNDITISSPKAPTSHVKLIT